MTCTKCHHGNTKRFGTYGKRRIQRWRCLSCSSTFSEPHARLTRATMTSRPDAGLMAIKCLLEGCSIRSTERLTGLNRNTILRLLVQTGEHCEKLLDATLVNLPVRDVECDEMWGYVAMKERAKTLLKREGHAIGDAYTFVAIERNTKLILAWHLGKRNRWETIAFIHKLRRATSGKFQLSTDGWTSYPEAVELAFGMDIHFAQLVKVYKNSREGEQRYSPAEVVDVEVVPRAGNPVPERICTSHVERQNLTMRMQMRRLTRLSNGFSKKWENLRAAVALHFAYYNLCRIHSSLRVTPAMEAGLTDHAWSLAELLGVSQ